MDGIDERILTGLDLVPGGRTAAIFDALGRPSQFSVRIIRERLVRLERADKVYHIRRGRSLRWYLVRKPSNAE